MKSLLEATATAQTLCDHINFFKEPLQKKLHLYSLPDDF